MEAAWYSQNCLLWFIYTRVQFRIRLVRVLQKAKKFFSSCVDWVCAQSANEIGRVNEP
jgi:hypothetical protein